ncbi:MAG: hydrogenase [Desulfamplus sp.]|nr:hydrogenase [Desulfamplus sp.]
MSLFFISLLIIASGGVLSPFFKHNFTTMKFIAVSTMIVGSIGGIIDSGSKLMSQSATINSCDYTASLTYLKSFTLSFQLDSLSAFFLVIIFAISLMASFYSFHYMDKPERSLGTAVNYLFFSLLVASMCLVVTASNMIAFMISWEMMSLSSFFLVIYNYKSKENRRAGYLYFIFSHVGAMFILSAFGVLYALTGDFDLSHSFASAVSPISNALANLSENQKVLIFILAFIGFGSKAGIFPFHVWLPHAHPAASSHISAVMSGVMIKTGIYGIIRIYSLLNFSSPVMGANQLIIGNSQFIGHIVIVAGVISGILGVVYALGQNDMKRLLAYSSMENIGIILIALGIGMIGVSSGNTAMVIIGFSGGFLHILNHSIFKSLLFMGAGVVLHKTGSRSIDALGGLIKNMRITGTTFLIGSLAISGLPPFNGFVSEFFIYMGGFKGVGMTAITVNDASVAGFAVNQFAMSRLTFGTTAFGIVSLAVIGGLALACFTKVVGVVFQGEPRTRAAEGVNEKGVAMLVPMVVFALLCLAIGVFPELPVLMSMNAISSLNISNIGTESGGASVIEITTKMIGMAGTISGAALLFISMILSVLLLRNFAYKNKPVTTSGTWGCGFTKPTVKMQYTGTSYAASIVEFFRPFAPIHEDHSPVKGRMAGRSHYQSHVNDIAELYMDRVTLKPVLFLFDKLHWIQHGDIHLYIGYILLAIVVAMFFV